MPASKKRRQSGVQLSIIIVNYNVRDFLRQALLSLNKARTGIPSEIIVVDNASDDGSVDMVKNKFPEVRILANNVNAGFAKANNMGLKLAKGEFCLLINPDTIVQENTLRVMLQFFGDHPDVGLAGCKILNPDGSPELACRRSFPTPWVAFTKMIGLAALFPESRWFARYNLTFRSFDETYEVDAVSGSFMMTRRAAFNDVGGLDENFFMYGEDLDWSYRIQQSGWKVYYVHTTSIVHYKGESTRRSGLNEIRTFYEAMHLFVRKHYGRSILLSWSLKVGISMSANIAIVRSMLRPLKYAFVDFFMVPVSMLLAEWIWRGGVFLYPSYAYPVVFVVPSVVVVGVLYSLDVYADRTMSVGRSLVGVFTSYLIISTLVAFFKTYAFSRMIIVLSGALCMILIPGWRLAWRSIGRARLEGKRSILGKRTFIVGTDAVARELLKRLRRHIAGDYEVIGFIARTTERIGRELDGIPILGAHENIAKVIRDHRVSDVIVSPESVSYADILSLMDKTREQPVNYHLVPSSMEVIIGKGNIDSLTELPLVKISYNIDQPSHRFTKRLFDLIVSGLLLMTVYPILRITNRSGAQHPSRFFAHLPDVFRGRMSLVGPSDERGKKSHPVLQMGKPGLTGLVQLQRNRALTAEEIDSLDLSYARNQSVMLDLEILVKSLLSHSQWGDTIPDTRETSGGNNIGQRS